MNQNTNDPFEYRSQGGFLNVGSEDGDNISTIIKVDNKLLCITRKNIRVILMADTIDPQRTNVDIEHGIQNELPYGSDNEFVGRTFQQSSILFKEQSLHDNIDYNKGINISFSFLNEIIALDKLKTEYLNEIKDIESIISLPRKNHHIPSVLNLNQKMKNFIFNIDHTTKSIIKLVQLFYPEIKSKGWEEGLYEKLKSQQGETNNFITFISTFKEFTKKNRKIRNTVEHPDNDNILTIENYKLNADNTLNKPSISFKSSEYNLPRIEISNFMKSTITNLVNIFELMMVHMCNLHSKQFAGDKRIVVPVLQNKRQESQKHVGFEYQILWTK